MTSQTLTGTISMMAPSDIFIDEFRVAAGEGAVLELKIRLLASKCPSLRPYVTKHLEKIEDAILALFAEQLDDSEQEQWRLSRQLRNKVLHCDFPRARLKLHELGEPQLRGGVRQLRFNSTTGRGMLDELLLATAEPSTTTREVADLTSSGEVDVYGWLLELGTAGDFRRAADVFRRTAAIVERLVVAADHLDRPSADSKPED